MLIAITSDIHDNIANLDKCLKWCKTKKIDTMICCGDVCDYETLKHLSENFNGEIFLVEGNGETYNDKDLPKLKNIKYKGLSGLENIDGLSLAFCHQEKDIPVLLKKPGAKPDFIFFGHSHKPWLEKKDDIFFVNPGNISGTFFQPTFATLDTKKKYLELKLIHDLT